MFGCLFCILTLKAFVATCSASTTPSIQEENFQARLVHDLFSNYGDGNVRPVFNTSTVTNVTYRPLVHELIEMDVRNQKIAISTQLKQTWRDEFLRWNASEYGGIKQIKIPSDRLWLPDITLHRNIDYDFEHIKNTRASVDSDGTVIWFAPAIFTSSCRIRVRYFPFDTQICNLRFGSWAYDGLELDLFPDTGKDAEQTSFLENGVWDLLEVHIHREVHQYACCPEPYPELIFRLILKRRSSFYISYLILPCVFLSALSLLVFYLPPESGEKLTLSITNLLALVVFQQLVAESMPPSGDDPPLLGHYFISMISMVCLSVITTVIVIHVSAKTGAVPYLLHLIFLRFLSRVVCMHRKEFENQRSTNMTKQVDDSPTVAFQLLNVESVPDGNGMPGNKTDDNENSRVIPDTVTDDLRFMRRDLEDRNQEEFKVLQWKHVGNVFDRCLLWIFLAFGTVASFIMISRAKGPEEHHH